MCGIFGVLRDDDRTPAEESLRESVRLLQHRGPDAQAIHAAPGIGLASARLSLVDPEPRSHQPFIDPSGRYALVYNGEVYNFRELAEQLVRDGVELRTTSDTEVVLHCLLREPASAALRRFDGMFALALYDRVERTLLLARDRFGMKPLYLCRDRGLFAFASEVKAFRPWLTLQAEPYSLAAYLLGFGGPTQGSTFYAGVVALAAGEVVTLRAGGAPQQRRYFALPEFWHRDELAAMAALGPRRAVDRLEELLFAGVKRQLFADARVGALCSGGVDSSLVVSMAARARAELAIFHADVVGPWSEVGAARRLAAHLGLELQVVPVQERDFVTELPQAMRHFEHPLTYLPNAVPFMKVARLARAHGVKGVLSGEGADELFLGYPWFWRQPLVGACRTLGRALLRLAPGAPLAGPALGRQDGVRARAVQTLLGGGETRGDEREVREAARRLAPARVDALQIASLDHLGHHLRMLLQRNDTLGMEAGVEARFPFLDHAVVRAAVNMPTRYKQRFSPFVFEKAHPFVRDKWVLREVARRWMPRRLAGRIKIGFWTTVQRRMRVAARYFDDSPLHDLLRVAPPELRSAVETADQDLQMRLLHLDVWARVCLDGASAEASAQRLSDAVSIRPA